MLFHFYLDVGHSKQNTHFFPNRYTFTVNKTIRFPRYVLPHS